MSFNFLSLSTRSISALSPKLIAHLSVAFGSSRCENDDDGALSPQCSAEISRFIYQSLVWAKLNGQCFKLQSFVALFISSCHSTWPSFCFLYFFVPLHNSWHAP